LQYFSLVPLWKCRHNGDHAECSLSSVRLSLSSPLFLFLSSLSPSLPLSLSPSPSPLLSQQVQQKDALIAEMNDQLHSNTAFRSEDADEALLKQQQMQRDIHELRTAVQERDQIITNLNSKIQQDGLVGETARGSQIAEREKAIAEQMVHLQEVAKHQYDMQAQLMEVQEMLQQQQAQMEEQSHQQALAQQQQLQMAAQSQQLAALQQGIGSYSQAGGDSKVFRIDDVPDEDEEDEDDGDGEGGVGGGRSAVQGKSISKTPTPKEWSQEQGSINASNRYQTQFSILPPLSINHCARKESLYYNNRPRPE
jgi:chromosome segregation ATPase